jgi:hypothetical protein
MPKEKASDTVSPEVVVRPIFRPGSELIGVPEIQMVSPSGLKLMETVSPTRPAVDLKAASKVWLLSGPGGGGAGRQMDDVADGRTGPVRDADCVGPDEPLPRHLVRQRASTGEQ